MSDLDMKSLSVEDLRKIKAQAEEQLWEKNQKRIKELREEARELSREIGLPVADIFGIKAAKTSRAKSGKASPKYQNPLNPKQKWSGLGRKPKWFVELIEQGYSEKDLLI